MIFWLLAWTWLPLLYCGIWVFGILLEVLLFEVPLEILVDTFVPLWPTVLTYLVLSLLVLGPIGLPPALLCLQIWRSGCRRTAWVAGIAMAAVTATFLYRYVIPTIPDRGSLVMVMHFLPVWIVACLAVFSAPQCIAVLVLQGRGTSAVVHETVHSAPREKHRVLSWETAGQVRFWMLALSCSHALSSRCWRSGQVSPVAWSSRRLLRWYMRLTSTTASGSISAPSWPMTSPRARMALKFCGSSRMSIGRRNAERNQCVSRASIPGRAEMASSQGNDLMTYTSLSQKRWRLVTALGNGNE